MSEWIEWRGGETMPVCKNTLVDIRMRDGTIAAREEPDHWLWVHSQESDDIVAYRISLGQPVPLPEEEHTGLSVSYYTTHIDAPTSGGEPYDAECNDIIEALNMTYAEANVFKAIWRIAASRQGKLKKGNNTVYDAEKAVFFSDRVLVTEKKRV